MTRSASSSSTRSDVRDPGRDGPGLPRGGRGRRARGVSREGAVPRSGEAGSLLRRRATRLAPTRSDVPGVSGGAFFWNAILFTRAPAPRGRRPDLGAAIDHSRAPTSSTSASASRFARQGWPSCAVATRCPSMTRSSRASGSATSWPSRLPTGRPTCSLASVPRSATASARSDRGRCRGRRPGVRRVDEADGKAPEAAEAPRTPASKAWSDLERLLLPFGA